MKAGGQTQGSGDVVTKPSICGTKTGITWKDKRRENKTKRGYFLQNSRNRTLSPSRFLSELIIGRKEVEGDKPSRKREDNAVNDSGSMHQGGRTGGWYRHKS